MYIASTFSVYLSRSSNIYKYGSFIALRLDRENFTNIYDIFNESLFYFSFISVF